MKKTFIFLILFSFGCNNIKKDIEDENSESTIFSTNSQGTQVTSIVLKPSIFQKEVIGNGLIQAAQRIELRFRVSERLTSIKVKNGQFVKKGEVLAKLDHTLLVNQMEKAQIELDRTKDIFNESKINFGIHKIPKDSVDPNLLRNLKIRSGYLKAKNELENAEFYYNNSILKAPFSGVIANLYVNEGDFINSGEVFCSIINPNDLEVSFAITEDDIVHVKTGQKIKVTSFVNPNKTYVGIISEINPVIDENGLIRIDAKISTSKNSLFHGMNAKIFIEKPVENLIVIPKQALVLRSNREVVFTIEDGLAKWNYVETVDENSKNYAIRKGLKLGDSIIVSGNLNLSQDAKVQVIDIPF